MEKEEEDIELIEQYLEDALQPEERRDFERRLSRDSDFNELYKDISKLVKGIQLVGSQDTLEYLQKLEETLPEIKHQPAKTSVPLWKQTNVMGMAASIVLLLVTGLFLLKGGKSDSDALFNQYFEVYPNQIAPTKRGDDQPATDRQKAYYAYDLGDYDAAISLFAQLPEDQDGGAPLFYTGMAHLAEGNAKQATIALNEYRAQYTVFADTAQWYLALSYLKNDQEDEGITLLKEVVDKNNSYSNRAKELLRSLE